jgi:hypothetical protein
MNVETNRSGSVWFFGAAQKLFARPAQAHRSCTQSPMLPMARAFSESRFPSGLLRRSKARFHARPHNNVRLN